MHATHTFATLEVPAAAFDFIAAKLKEAGYEHAFVDGALDMHGIGLVKLAPAEDFRERVRQEKRELDEKRTKLATFMAAGGFGNLPDIERQCLYNQAEAMNRYSQVLAYRIARFP